MRLTVVTNGMHSALELKENPEITVIVVGGAIRVGSASLECTLGASIFNQINVDTMFTSASGLTLENGLTDFNVYEVELKRAMVACSNRVVVLLDDSKFGKNSIASFAAIDEIDTIITNSKMPQENIEKIKSKNINVIIS